MKKCYISVANIILRPMYYFNVKAVFLPTEVIDIVGRNINYIVELSSRMEIPFINAKTVLK